MEADATKPIKAMETVVSSYLNEALLSFSFLASRSCDKANTVSMSVVYAPIPLEEGGKPASGRGPPRISSRQGFVNATLVTVVSAVAAFIVGFFVGQLHLGQHSGATSPSNPIEEGHLPPGAFFPSSKNLGL